MKRRAIPYPYIGYCITDARGYCTACAGMASFCWFNADFGRITLPSLSGNVCRIAGQPCPFRHFRRPQAGGKPCFKAASVRTRNLAHKLLSAHRYAGSLAIRSRNCSRRHHVTHRNRKQPV